MKKILCKICFIGLFVCVGSILWAQENHGGNILPAKEFFFTISPHTIGTSVGIDYGFIGNKLTHSIHFELTSLRHPKEARQASGAGTGNSFGNVSRSFVYGKQHQFYGIHAGYGGKFHFSNRAESMGVMVSISYAAGPSLGVLRPYYLNLTTGGSEPTAQTYTEENASIFLTPANISGASGLSYGWNELSYVAGGFAKLGLNFEWGKPARFITAVDVGIMLNIYTEKIPIVLVAENQAIFPTLYAAFQIGKRP